MQKMRKMREMLYSGECRQILGMSSNIPGNIAKHPGKFPQTFRGIFRL